MKKIYTLIATVAVVFSASAQRTVSTVTPISTVGVPTLNTNRTVTDTLVGYSWTNASAVGATFIGSANGGYVAGNNGYDDFQKAQSFLNTIGNINVEGALMWFGAKQSDAGSSGTSKVQVRHHSLNAAGTTSGGASTTAPGTVNRTADLLFSAIDTGFVYTPEVVMFSTPVFTTGDFAIGLNFPTLAAGDTVGLIHSSDGDAGATDMSWEQWSDNSWHTMFQAWPLDIDFFIWALVDINVGIEEQGFLNGARLGQNVPNPATNNTTVTYAIENNTSNVSLMIFDVTGKLVATYNEGNKAAGTHSVLVETATLENGTYFYALTAGKGRIAKKMTVSK